MNPPELISKAVRLDEAGFLPLPGEGMEDFFRRFETARKASEAFAQELTHCGSAQVFDEGKVSADSKIPDEIIAEAAEVTKNLYAFENHRVPGFFLSGAVGLLWGGCMIGDPDNGFAVFLLRNVFAQKQRWLFYCRRELLAHELCHAMRQSLEEPRLEEYFAYQTSPSWLRRKFGNCFVSDWDAILFLFPALLLLAAAVIRIFVPALPLWPLWGAVFAVPVWLLFRNACSVRVLKKAERNLKIFGISNPGPILFRSTWRELEEIGELTDAAAFARWVGQCAEKEVRWQIIRERFLQRSEA